MREFRLRFRCYHPDCGGDPPTEVILKVAEARDTPGRTIEREVYCEQNHLNLVDVPAGWNARPPVFGEDIGGNRGELPLLQGRRP